MELELFGNLAWLLLGGAAFFAAMRLAANRHSGNDDRLDLIETCDVTVLRCAPVRDPVCGMVLDPSGDISWIHGGRTYYFCSMSCRGRFRASPQQFIKPRAAVLRPLA